MIRTLIDTNVILDFALQRKPHFEATEQLFVEIGNGKIQGYITATTVTDIYYIVAKTIDTNTAHTLYNPND